MTRRRARVPAALGRLALTRGALGPLAFATALGAGCSTPEPLVVDARWAGAGVEVHASAPVQAVVVRDATGRALVRQSLPAASAEVYLDLHVDPGEVRIEVTGATGAAATTLTVPPEVPWLAEVQPAPGAEWVLATGIIEVPTWGESAAIFLRLTAGPAAVDVPVDGALVRLPAPGSRRVVPLTLTTRTTLQVGDAAVTLVPVVRDPVAARAALVVSPLVFPADGSGLRDLGRPADSIVLPSPAWERTLAALGWGVHARTRDEPWSFVTVPLHNAGADPLDVVVTAVVRDPGGGAAPAFQPRLRSADGGADRVAALLRVPPGQDAAAVLPVFVDAVGVAAGPYTLDVAITPLGAPDALGRVEEVITVRRGDALSSLGFAITALASIGGLAWTAARLPRWLQRASTTDMMVNALFATALFVISTATDVVAISVGAVLGPFATLATGLLYDAGRTVLLATLLQLQPRPGTLALGILCSWLGRGVLMGTVGPPDLIYTGAAIAIGEAFAYLSGVTRGRPLSFARLALAFGPSSALLTLAGLWIHTVLYRLHFATWYVLLQVGLPGFVYVLVACGFAVPFARSLREVDA